jgi:hypothetical protein
MANTSYGPDTKKLKLKALHLAMHFVITLMNCLQEKKKGDGLSRKGKHIVHEDLEIAFDLMYSWRT